MGESKGLAFADAIQTGLDESSQAPPSDLWTPTNAGEWLLGEVADITERESRGRDGGEARKFKLYQVYGKTGEKARDVPKTEDAMFDAKADLIPVADGRVGLRRCLRMKVDGTDNRRGAQVGDCVLLKCLGKQGNAFQYGGYLWAPQESRVPQSVRDQIAEQERQYQEDRASGGGDEADDAGDTVDDPDGVLD